MCRILVRGLRKNTHTHTERERERERERDSGIERERERLRHIVRWLPVTAAEQISFYFYGKEWVSNLTMMPVTK